MSRTAAGYFGRASSSQPEVITGDRECEACGYNLRGLREGGRCPECGAAIPPELTTTGDHALSSMPLRVIRIFQRGAWLATAAVVAVGAMNIAIIFGWLPGEARLWVIGAAAAAWVAAAWMLTPAMTIPEAVSRGFSRDGVTRRIARWGQVGWLVAYAAVLAGEFIPGAELAAAVLLGLGALAGAVGLIAAAVMMERLAEWARDDAAQNAFHWFEWLMPASIIGVTIFSGASLVAAVLGLLMVAAMLIFVFGLLMLTKSLTLAGVHSMEYIEREQRRRERRQRDQEAFDARIEALNRANAERGD